MRVHYYTYVRTLILHPSTPHYTILYHPTPSYTILHHPTPSYTTLHHSTPHKKLLYWLSAIYKESAKNIEKSCSKIWSVHKKTVPLQPISRQTQVSVDKRRKVLKRCNAENQPLTKKVQKILKKVAKKFGQSKKKQYLCSRFRNKREWALKNSRNQ